VAQKVEHYEIASYGSVKAWADQLGHEEITALLEETLKEERALIVIALLSWPTDDQRGSGDGGLRIIREER
jgi:hypothetical protein